MFQVRQGDLLFNEVKQPKGTKKLNEPILAHGEATGHAHRIMEPEFSSLESCVDENGDIFVMNPNGPIVVGHEEHGQITCPPNKWICVTRQREYDALATMRERKVAD
jgi:hypothetical protein